MVMAAARNKTNLFRHPLGHTQKAYQGIRRMLFHNELAPGQKISYRDLAERLKMSQTPVIQALKWLEFQQLVRHEPHRGCYPAPISIKEVEEIYDLRELIELDLLAKTIRSLGSTEIKSLKAALEGHLAAAREIYLYDRLLKDMEFHLSLARLADCKVQHQTLRNLFDLLYLKYGGTLLFSTSMERADADHQALFSKISARDSTGARRVLRDHIRRVKRHVLTGLKQMVAARQMDV
jgi:DNA-binding GntR family transcriptional regulator